MVWEVSIEVSISMQETMAKPPKQRTLLEVLFISHIVRSKISLLRGMGQEELLDMCRHMTMNFYKNGQVVVVERDIGSDFFLLLAGRVDILQGQSEEGQALHRMSPNSILSKQALDSEGYSAAVLCKVDAGDTFGTLAILAKVASP